MTTQYDMYALDNGHNAIIADTYNNTPDDLFVITSYTLDEQRGKLVEPSVRNAPRKLVFTDDKTGRVITGTRVISPAEELNRFLHLYKYRAAVDPTWHLLQSDAIGKHVAQIEKAIQSPVADHPPVI
jgi:hypothetical protein